MNATKQSHKGRKLHKEDCPQKVAAEQREYAGVPRSVRIAETRDIIADLPADSLLKRIISRDNMNNAFLKVKSNRGVGGIDKMSVDELLPYLREHRLSLLQQIKDGKYKPNPVRRVEIPKEEKGKFRKLGIPTVVDRVVQQAIAQVLTPIYESQFSDASFGFRPGRGAHDALKACLRKVLRHSLPEQTDRGALKKHKRRQGNFADTQISQCGSNPAGDV